MKTLLKIYYGIKNQRNKIYFNNECNKLIFEFYSNSKTYSKMHLLYYDGINSQCYFHNLIRYEIANGFWQWMEDKIISLYLNNMFRCKN